MSQRITTCTVTGQLNVYKVDCCSDINDGNFTNQPLSDLESNVLQEETC